MNESFYYTPQKMSFYNFIVYYLSVWKYTHTKVFELISFLSQFKMKCYSFVSI